MDARKKKLYNTKEYEIHSNRTIHLENLKIKIQNGIIDFHILSTVTSPINLF